MAPKNILAEVVRRHPELKTFSARQLRLVKQVVKEAAALSAREILTPEETEAVFRRRVRDSGTPSAALRAYRKRTNLTQRQLAKKSRVPQPHIAAMESGARPIGLMSAKKLALALGVDYRKLV